MNSKLIRLKHWQRELLLLVVCLFVGNNINAGVHFKDEGMMTIIHQPTLTEPYIIVDVLYFDAYGGDGYFTDRKIEGSNPGAAVYVDGKYICSPWELTWNKDQSAANNFRDQNSWTKKSGVVSEYSNDYATIRFYDPRHEASSGAAEDRYRVYMYIFLKAWEAGVQHTVKVRGYWVINAKGSTAGSSGFEEQVLTTNNFGSPWSDNPTATMNDLTTVSLSGNLAKDYGPTTVSIYDRSTSAPSTYMNADFAATKEYNKGGTSFSGYTATLEQTDGRILNGRNLPIQYSFPVSVSVPAPASGSTTTPKDAITISNMVVYKWFTASVPGFVLPKNLKYSVTDQWTKKVQLNWDVNKSNSRVDKGTWTIRNATAGNNIKTGLSYEDKSFEFTLDEYSKDYDLEVYFVPEGSSKLYSVLRSKITANIAPQWAFSDFLVKEDDGKMVLTWKHNAFDDASGSKSYTLTIQRRKAGTETWSDIGSVNITSNSTTEGTYTDNNNLTANTNYEYQIKVNVLGADRFSSVVPCRLGGSKFESFTASRGNYSSMVKLQWTVKQSGNGSTNFIIKRRPYGSDNDADWADIHTTSGNVSSYSYDDVTALPGSFNEYMAVIWSQDGDDIYYDDSRKTDGFSIATGHISGNISYGTGTAVNNAKVVVKRKDSDGEMSRGMYSLLFRGAGSGLKYTTSDSTIVKSLFDESFSIQMYLKPDNTSAREHYYYLFDVNSEFLLYLKSTYYWPVNYELGVQINGVNYVTEGLAIKSNEWSQVNCVYDSSTKTITFYLAKDGQLRSKIPVDYQSRKADNVTPSVSSKANSFVIANSSSLGAAQYNGYMDEFRFFTKALTEDEILHNYNHPLAGDEAGLAMYYPFDEGMNSQTIAYDFSKKNGITNGRHVLANTPAAGTDQIPSEEELSLMAYTDIDGDYEIRGIPFSGEGTSYVIFPELGIHEFSPAKQNRYISMSTLNHSGVNFEDVSSFPVSGKIFYEGTDYPVEGVNFYVDGTICSKDGEVIETNAQGEFTISVPIGDHFITAKKNGHVFAEGGRYPADPNGVNVKHTFDREIKNMEFIDKTLVNFTGRVVGGDIEGDKSVGFGMSTNNIGVTELLLTPLNEIPRMNVKKVVSETTYSYETNDKTVEIASATDKIASKSWRGEGADNCRKLYIHTDSATGEFSAMLPPLEYKLAPVKVVKTGLEVASSTTIDLSNPLSEYSDTLYYDDGSYQLYTYNTLLKQIYHSEPTFIVKQDGKGNKDTGADNAFGIKSYELKDDNGDLTIDDIYTVGTDSKPVYKYGGAIFEMNDSYTFNIEGFEEYVNTDGGQPVTDHVPLAGVVVTIDNALSDQQPIFTSDFNSEELAAAGYDGSSASAGQVADLKSNQLELDSLGKAIYTWTAGLPNVTAPYTRTISMTYDVNSRTYDWSESGMKGVVLGSLPTGNNFVTSGPDMIDMILRDPAGSGSSAEWSSGTITNLSNVVTANFSNETGLTTTTKLGKKVDTASGIGVAVINSTEAKNDLTIGAKVKIESESSYSWNRTVETTRTISTSDSPDFVGADGDVFIGSATNVIFGKARNVDFHRIGTGNTVKLDMQNAITTGLEFSTMFNYTQHYIENELLPNLIELRNNLLKTVTPDVYDHYDMTGKTEPVYLTKLSPDDEKFGTSNNDEEVWGNAASKGLSSVGPSYKMLVPDVNEDYQDKIVWYNNQIETWIKYLALNEEHKVKAFENRSKDTKNISFDAGAKVTNSVETQESHGGKFMLHAEVAVQLGMNFGAVFDGTGVIFDVQTETTVGLKEEFEGSKATKTVFSYTLAEEGTDDALTVDVYEYDDYGPIFRTRGGQTSAPYEGKVVTKYYKPGTTIMEATMQIEVPQIDVDVPTMSDIPTGSAANYTLRLGNASEVGKDVGYKLFVLNETNPNGAQLSIDGKVLTEGRIIKVPGSQTLTKALQLRQTDIGVLDYDRIGIVFASESQPEDIADTVYITAHFTPSSSEVKLALSNTVINTQTGTDLDLTFSDFDRNYKNLKAFRLEFKKPGETDWTKIQEYVLDAKNKTASNEMMPETGSSVKYKLPMASFSDGNYTFRAVSASTYGTGEVCRYSDEIELVKDMQRPTPLGQPEPTDGILEIGEELSVAFNEAILKGELTKEANFKITGVLNGAAVAHETALSIQSADITAITDANYSFEGKSFSIDAWVNLNGGEGTLLSLGSGTNKFSIGTNASNNLVVKIGYSTSTSSATIPTGKWVFLSMNYDTSGRGCALNASVATDDDIIELFKNKSVRYFDGNGPLAIGNLKGAIHELLLWDEAHDMTTALLNRNFTKNPSTRHLIGYWKMNEGEGKTIRDYSRNRHMTMTNATWYMNNVNKAVSLNGQSYMTINASELPFGYEDDYAIEFWMRGAAQNDAQLVQMGEVALWIKADGTLQLTGKNAYSSADETVLATSATNLTDNAWHHIALNVLRQGAAAVYVDGIRCLTTNAVNVGNIATNYMIIGARRITSVTDGAYSYDRAFNGIVDEIRIWNATMNSDQLLKNRNVRLTGSEDGLVVYYSFEKKGLDSGNQVITMGNDADLCSNHTVQLYKVNAGEQTLNYSDDAPALRTKPTETNVSFTFVASNEKIVINIDEDPATIEGCTLNFTVRDVRDENGNYSVPAVWSAFINQKELDWDEDELNVKQQVKGESSVTATVINKSGAQQMWTISGMPSWLTASSEYGTTNPLAQSNVTFYVSPATPIGKYQEIIYLKSNNGIETPLTLNITVTGQEPAWSVNANDFENSMNVIGRVMVEGVPMDDTDDIVAAFIGEECRGVAHPVYSSRYDSYFVTMDIYGNGDVNQDVTFRAYDASTGTLYPEVVANSAIKFVPLTLEGAYSDPVELTALDKIEQTIELKEGWNWISLYVAADNMTVSSLFEKIAEDVVIVKSQNNGYLMYENNGWGGDLTGDLANKQMYAVKMKSDRTLRIVGERFNPSAITVKAGWNWIGYYGRQVASVSDAMVGVSPVSGDILKGQNGVTYYDSYEWAGSLIMMEPGVGYMMKSTTDYTRDFSYPSASLASRRSSERDTAVEADAVERTFNSVDFRNYSSNAIMTAKVVKGNVPMANVEVGVFADGECRTMAVTDENGMVYLTIPGDDAAALNLMVAYDNDVTETGDTFNFETDAIYGTPQNPYIIKVDNDFGSMNNNGTGNESIYDLQGRKVPQVAGQTEKGIFIINGQKKMAR